MENYLIVAGSDMTQHQVRTFKTDEQLQAHNREFNEEGFRLKNCDLYPTPKREGGVALWHIDTDFELKI